MDKLRRKPVQPLRIHLSDGATYDIPEPGRAAIALTELYLGVEPDETGLPTRSVHGDARHVVRVERLVAAGADGGVVME